MVPAEFAKIENQGMPVNLDMAIMLDRVGDRNMPNRSGTLRGLATLMTATSCGLIRTPVAHHR